MGWQCSWRVTCESCSAAGPLALASRDAEAKAIKKGWRKGQVFGMALHLCPECAAKPLPEWWPDESGTKFHHEVPT